MEGKHIFKDQIPDDDPKVRKTGKPTVWIKIPHNHSNTLRPFETAYKELLEELLRKARVFGVVQATLGRVMFGRSMLQGLLGADIGLQLDQQAVRVVIQPLPNTSRRAFLLSPPAALSLTSLYSKLAKAHRRICQRAGVAPVEAPTSKAKEVKLVRDVPAALATEFEKREADGLAANLSAKIAGEQLQTEEAALALHQLEIWRAERDIQARERLLEQKKAHLLALKADALAKQQAIGKLRSEIEEDKRTAIRAMAECEALLRRLK